jgi:2-C-methyl-D-erythritol 4-phosphate cytidylyltransferase
MPTFSVAILTAGPMGQAAEAGGAYVKLDGREALLRSVELFLNREPIKQIQVVVMPDDMEESKRKYGPHLSFSGVKLISGGPKWTDQIAAAAKTLAGEATHVILHDAARPLVPYSDIDAILEEAGKETVVALTAPLRFQLIQVDQHGNPMHHWRGDEFVQLLTPQAFRKDQFIALAGSKDPLPLSHAKLIKGSPLNQRIGGSGDASLARALMNLLPKPKLKPPSSPFEEAQW